MSTQQQTLSQPRPKLYSPVATGLALFSMFFGAGNLIFPLLIGKLVGSQAWSAVGGLGITAVLMPFLGLVTMTLYRADHQLFFGRMGKIPGLFIVFLLQVILGPFGVIPRLITLMHAMSKPYLWEIPLFPFTVLISCLIFVMSVQRDKLIRYLSFLTPFLILSLVALVFSGLIHADSFAVTSKTQADSFLDGLIGGYNTMDLIAAFMFASVMLPHFRSETSHGKSIEKNAAPLNKMLLSSAIAAPLLLLVYLGLSLISAYHSWTLDPAVLPEQLLGAIARALLGPVGGFLAALTVILACLTTTMTLAPIFAQYLRNDLLREKLSPRLCLVVTLIIGTLFANLGFSGISSILGPILEIVYPGLIVLTVCNLLHALFGWKPVKVPVYLTLLFSVGYFLFHM